MLIIANYCKSNAMKMQIKTTMRYHLTPVRMATFKKSTNNKGREGVEKRQHPYTVGRNAD